MIELTLSRYLVKPVFSLLLVIGATIGVACLLVVLSLFENYYLSMEKVFMGIHPHIEIHKDNMSVKEANKLKKKIKKEFTDETSMVTSAYYDEVTINVMETVAHKSFCMKKNSENICFERKKGVRNTISPTTQYGFDITKSDNIKVFIKGITVENNKTVMQLKGIITGTSNLDRLAQTKNENGAEVIPSFLMESISPDKILDHYLLNKNNSTSKAKHFRLVGSLDLGRKKDEKPLLVLSLENSWKLLDMKPTINTIEISLVKPYDSEILASKMQALLGDKYDVDNWTSREQTSFIFLKVTKLMTYALLFSISIVAAIGVYSTLLLAVMQNQKKIAILKALGIRNSSIYFIFMSNALIVGVFGVILGSLLGYVGSEWLVSQFAENLKKLGLEDPQTRISVQDFLIMSFFTLGLFVITAITPAKRAVAVDPVDNLQH